MIIELPIKLALDQTIYCKKCDNYHKFTNLSEENTRSKNEKTFAFLCDGCGETLVLIKYGLAQYNRFVAKCEAIDRLLTAVDREKSAKNKKRWNKFSEETYSALVNYRLFKDDKVDEIDQKAEARIAKKNIKKDYVKSPVLDKTFINPTEHFNKLYGKRKNKRKK